MNASYSLHKPSALVLALIQEIGGRQPMTVEQCVTKHREAFL
jgi:hypothetical protein